MKNLTYSLFAFLLVAFTLQGCDKTNLVPLTGQLVASKDTVRMGEPDSLIVVGADADSVLWNVNPTGFHGIVQSKNKARITFVKAGAYTVSASVNGGTPFTKLITVTDSVYQPAPQYALVALNGEKITLEPHYYKNAAGDTTYLYFNAVTAYSYGCLNSVITYTRNQTVGSYSIDFDKVRQPDGAFCSPSSQAYARATITFYQNPMNSFMAAGTYPLAVKMNGNTYIGSFTVTATTIAFNWPYTTPITISPSLISR